MATRKPRAKKIKIIKVEPIMQPYPLSPVPEGAESFTPTRTDMSKEPMVLGHRVELEVYEAPIPPPAIEPPTEPIDLGTVSYPASSPEWTWARWWKSLW